MKANDLKALCMKYCNARDERKRALKEFKSSRKRCELYPAFGVACRHKRGRDDYCDSCKTSSSLYSAYRKAAARQAGALNALMNAVRKER